MKLKKIKETIRIFMAPAVVVGEISQGDLDKFLSSVIGDGTKRDSLITYREAAEQLGLSTKTVKRMVDSGALKSKRLRAECLKSIRVFQSSIDSILTPESENSQD